MGLGSFGGARGCVQWLLEQGAEVTITDLRTEDELQESLAEIPADACRLVLGTHEENDFDHAQIVVVNPAVPCPWDNRYLQIARSSGAILTTEIGLTIQRIDRMRCIAISGSAGKSTTAAMTYHLLKTGGTQAVLGGNIGGSLLPNIGQIHPNSWVVLELSSAQLHWLAIEGGWSPHIAGLTNVHPNHLDWHGSFAHYQECKMHLHRFQTPDDVFIRGDELPPYPGELPVPGVHNQHNAALAIELATATGTPINPADLNTFGGLPHRLCRIETDGPYQFIDDSKSTTPEATVLAVQSLGPPEHTHLIAGGYDKGADLSPISDLAARLAGLYTIGQTGPALAARAPKDAHDCGTLEKAVAVARSHMKPGHTLLLSPGCASWDQFTDFRARGTQFVKLVGTP